MYIKKLQSINKKKKPEIENMRKRLEVMEKYASEYGSLESEIDDFKLEKDKSTEVNNLLNV